MLTNNINGLRVVEKEKAVENNGLSYRASPIVKISNQLLEDFKKIYELKPILPVSALKYKNLGRKNKTDSID